MYNLDHSLDEILKAFGLEHTNIYVKSVVSLGAIAVGSFGDGIINLSHNDLFNAITILLKAGSQTVGIVLGSITILKVLIDLTKYFIKKFKKKENGQDNIGKD
jgi:hypothetical protein